MNVLGATSSSSPRSAEITIPVGVYRLGFEDADMEARRWLMTRIEDAGGTARLDGAGNVLGRFFTTNNPRLS